MAERQYSITTDYKGNRSRLAEVLPSAAEAGFTDVMHCHGWNSSEHYGRADMVWIKQMLDDNKLGVVDVHGSVGPSFEVWSTDRGVQDTGIALVRNRIELARTIGADVVVLHIPTEEDPRYGAELWDSLDRFMADMEPELRSSGVRFAFENLEKRPAQGLLSNFDTVGKILDRYPSDLVGLCYDSGHGNVDGDGIDKLSTVKDRLIAVHLHGNDGTSDQHNSLFQGTIDWQRLSTELAQSSYAKPLSSESSMDDTLGTDKEEAEFLRTIITEEDAVYSTMEQIKKTA